MNYLLFKGQLLGLSEKSVPIKSVRGRHQQVAIHFGSYIGNYLSYSWQMYHKFILENSLCG